MPRGSGWGYTRGPMPIEIKLLGPTDDTYQQAYVAVQEAIAHARLPVKLTTLDDPAQLRGHGIEVAPALVVNGEIKLAGRAPSVEQLKLVLS